MSEVKDLIFSKPTDGDITPISFSRVFGTNQTPSCEQPEWNKLAKIEEEFRPSASKLIDARATYENVIIRVRWRQPILSFSDEKQVRTLQPDEKVVVSYGGRTLGVDIGDKVFVSYHATIEPIRIPNNDMSLEGILKARADHKNADFFKNVAKKITVYEYYIVPIYAIKAVVGNIYTDTNEAK